MPFKTVVVPALSAALCLAAVSLAAQRPTVAPASQWSPLGVGDTATAPAGVHHYAVAKRPTIIAVTVMGPYVIEYVKQ